MKMTMCRNDVFAVMLTRMDGRVCRWEFKRYTLRRVKNIIKDYVESCPYDCEWKIRGNGVNIQGRSR